MAPTRERALSEAKEPHPVVLKVLRLCRPTLSTHHPAPLSSAPDVPTAPSLLAPIHALTDTFSLQPLLTLPPSFGSVFIGETFRCCLSATCSTAAPSIAVTGVTIQAEMQTPTQKLGLELGGSDASIVEFELKEEGPHVLAVTVTYQQSIGPAAPIPGKGEKQQPEEEGALQLPIATRERSFRKLYQFSAMHCVLIRTKATILSAAVPIPDPVTEKEKTGEGDASEQSAQADVVLEAQIENVSESTVVLERCEVMGKRKCRALLHEDKMVLKSRDVVQIAFLIGTGKDERKRAIEGSVAVMDADRKDAGIGQLVLGWRSQCGEIGVLKTGRLAMPVV